MDDNAAAAAATATAAAAQPAPAGLLSGPAAMPPERLPALIDAGCSLAYVRVHGMSPLLYCCAAYDEELAIRILREGVDVDIDAPDQSGFTPLHYAADAGLEELARELLARGCDTAARNDDIVMPFGPPAVGGKAPLHLAACRGDEVMLQLLLDGGAQLAQLDVDGNSAWALACMHGQSSAAALLAARRVALPPGEAAVSPTTTTVTPELTAEDGARKRTADQHAASARLKRLGEPSGLLLEVHREREIWSAQQCEELLLAVADAVAARSGSWETTRHTAHATTDLPAAELLLPAYRSLCEQLHAGLLPKLGECLHSLTRPPARSIGRASIYLYRGIVYIRYSLGGHGGILNKAVVGRPQHDSFI
jgi:ankyrin repeat protein